MSPRALGSAGLGLALAVLMGGGCGTEATAPTTPVATERVAPHQSGPPTPRAATREKTTPFPSPATPDVEKALAVLGAVVDTYAADPDNPWAVAHGLLARGSGFTLTNGRAAVPYLFERYAFEQELAGRSLVGFPRELDGVRVEPHTDLVLKNLSESDLGPDFVVNVGGHEHTLGDLWQHSLLTTFLKKSDGSSSYDSPNDMPWGLSGLAAWGPPDLAWTSWDGTAMDMDDMARLLVHVLTSESGFMLEAMVNGQDFQKRGQGIFKYTCGGAHLLQGAAHVVARGYGGPQELDKIKAQGRLLYYRLPRELAIYQEAMKTHPNRRLVLMVQQLKFVGHWLESAHKLAIAELYAPDSAEQLLLAQAVGVAVDTTRELKALGAFDNLEQLRVKNEQLYLDVVGDSSHAIRGLELALGRGAYRY